MSSHPKTASEVQVDQIVWIEEGMLSVKVKRVAMHGRFQWLKLRVLRNDTSEEVPEKLGRCHVALSSQVIKLVSILALLFSISSCACQRTDIQAQEAFGLSYSVGTPFHTIKGD